MPGDREETPYYLAARFTGERPAGAAYFRIQDLIFNEPCDLSVYRLQIRGVWHVAIVGDAPNQELDQQLLEILSVGESVNLDEQVLRVLQERGANQRSRGPWTERHNRPGQGFRLDK